MACARRSLTSTYTLLSRRLQPSLSHLLPLERNRDGDGDGEADNSGSLPFRDFHGRGNALSGMWTRERSGLGFASPFGFEQARRGYASTPSGESNEVGFAKDVTNVLTEKGADVADVWAEKSVEVAQAAGPTVGEVAAAAADSAPPVAALQYVIDAVHNFTGLNWWGAIIVTSLMIRCCTVPLTIHQLKATSKLTVLKPELEKLKEQMHNATDQRIVQENQRQIKELFKKHKVSPFTPLKGMFIQGPVFISFYFAISNMVEKVPSFKDGGAFWFTDLTTPDPLYALPILAGLSFLLTVELNMQEGVEGNAMASNMKKFSRLLAFLTVPFTASFPKAIFCYWITSNLFSLTYGMVLKRPPVRKFLNLPEVAKQPSSSPASQPTLSFFGASKQSPQTTSPSPVSAGQQSQYSNRRISSSSVISQRIRNLEKNVKGRSKSKKRISE